MRRSRSPKPLHAEDVQKLLRTDEVLVFFLAGDKESYVFALTPSGFEWKVIPLGGDALAEQVTAFRHGLDVDQFNIAIATGKKSELFDLGLANELYSDASWTRRGAGQGQEASCSSCRTAHSPRCRSICW